MSDVNLLVICVNATGFAYAIEDYGSSGFSSKPVAPSGSPARLKMQWVRFRFCQCDCGSLESQSPVSAHSSRRLTEIEQVAPKGS